MNYEKLYFEQKSVSLNLEMQLMNMRAQAIEVERIEVQKKLKKYEVKKDGKV